MKISSSSQSLQSAWQTTEIQSEQQSFSAWVSQPVSSPSPSVSLSSAAQSAAAADAQDSGTELDPKLQLLIALLERLTGYKFHVFTASQIAVPDSSGSPSTQPASAPQASYGATYSQTQSYSFSEQTDFQASGTVQTSDGRQIQFNLGLSMQYQYSETSSAQIQIGSAAPTKDPLVINFNGTAAQLSDQKFSFDLDSDGTDEEISAPVSGTGFLALDLNGDGKIDDGSELFGTQSGNGFADLAQYDSDGNGWIDESDPAFNQLKVWTPDASGNGTLNSLADLGIGAISLASVSTPFSIRNAANQVLGAVRASGVVLNEDGSAGSVQQVDLTA